MYATFTDGFGRDRIERVLARFFAEDGRDWVVVNDEFSLPRLVPVDEVHRFMNERPR